MLNRTYLPAVLIAAIQLNAQPRAMPLDPPGITVEAGGKLVHRTPVSYPFAVVQKRIEGLVEAELTLNSSGAVVDARILSGPEDLRKPVLESVLNWHYETGTSSKVRVSIEFRIPVSGQVAANVPAIASRAGEPPILEKVDADGLPGPLRDVVRSRTSQYVGKQVTIEVMEAVREAISNVDQHLNVASMSNPATRNVIVMVHLADHRANLPPGGETEFPPSGEKRIRVGGAVMAAKLIEQKAPVYPPLAKEARIQGTVRFNVLISKEGKVADVRLISGHPLLVPPAMDALKEWSYQPTLLNGNPVEVVTAADVNFTLSN